MNDLVPFDPKKHRDHLAGIRVNKGLLGNLFRPDETAQEIEKYEKMYKLMEVKYKYLEMADKCQRKQFEIEHSGDAIAYEIMHRRRMYDAEFASKTLDNQIKALDVDHKLSEMKRLNYENKKSELDLDHQSGMNTKTQAEMDAKVRILNNKLQQQELETEKERRAMYD